MHAADLQMFPKTCNDMCTISETSAGPLPNDRYSRRPDSGIYFYVRRVPKELANLDPRKVVRESLKTRSENEARIQAAEIDKALEAYWASLLMGQRAPDARARYDAAVSLAKSLGLVYRSAAEIMRMGPGETLSRLKLIDDKIDQPQVVEAVLGTAPDVDVRLSNLVETYLDKHKVYLSGKSVAQLKKHKQQREGSVAVAQAIIGDKLLKDVTRTDTLLYRQHWVDRVAAGEVTRESANRTMSDVKGMLSVLDPAYGVSWGKVWDDLRIRGKKQTKDRRRRPPYPPDFISKKLLSAGALDGLNFEARMSVYGMIETGMGPSEICNLRPEDIRLDHAIPHVAVAERDDREQKTVYRIREIPLVGVSLWAFKQCPGGFPRYRDKGTALSGAINKYLKENGLRPLPKNSIYSLRHNFQDRMTAAGANDRLQVDLMGHELGRQSYGEGAPLEQKLELLERIKFAWTPAQPNQPSSQS